MQEALGQGRVCFRPLSSFWGGQKSSEVLGWDVSPCPKSPSSLCLCLFLGDMGPKSRARIHPQSRIILSQDP